MPADPRVIRALADVDETEVEEELATLPTLDDWPGISEAEQARRQQLLERIAARIRKEGPHVAYPSPVRGRQFMPFAALKGYKEMLQEVEREVNAQK